MIKAENNIVAWLNVKRYLVYFYETSSLGYLIGDLPHTWSHEIHQTDIKPFPPHCVQEPNEVALSVGKILSEILRKTGMKRISEL